MTKEERFRSTLKADSLWEYKGAVYRIMFNVDEHTLIQYEDEWYPTVKYRNLEYNGNTYYRSSKEFLEKFRPYTD